MIKREILEQVSLQEIKLYKNNPRKNDNSVEFVVNSIKEFGYGNPIIVDENMEVIAGHTRLKAIKKLGWETLPEVVKISGLTEEQKKAYRIADNSTGQNSEWDIDLLNLELQDISLDMVDFGLVLPEVLEPDEKDDEVPEIPKEARSKLGDLIELGEHRLFVGDCTLVDNVDKLMNGQKADMVFTDPPYNVNYSGRGAQTSNKIKNDNMDLNKFKDFLSDSFSTMSLSAKAGACLYVCHTDGKPMIRATFEEVFNIYFKQSCTIIWVKNVASMGWQDYRGQHEPILYGWNNGEHTFYGDRCQTTVWSIGREGNYKHPTQKPIDLIIKAILNSSKTEDVVNDFFGGSGSTLIACEKTKRKCYMMELDEKYCDVIIQRYVDYTGNNNIKVNGEQIKW